MWCYCNVICQRLIPKSVSRTTAFSVLILKCQPQTLEFLKTIKSEPLLKKVGHTSLMPSRSGNEKKKPQAPRKKSSRQFLFPLGLILWHHRTWHWPSLLWFPASFLRILSQRGFSPSWETLSDHMRSRGRRLEADSLGKQTPASLPDQVRALDPDVHQYTSLLPITSPLSGQESHGRIWIEATKGHTGGFQLSDHPLHRLRGRIPWDEYQVAAGGGMAELWSISHAGKHSKAWQKHRQVHNSRTQQQNISKAERLGSGDTAKQVSQHVLSGG